MVRWSNFPRTRIYISAFQSPKWMVGNKWFHIWITWSIMHPLDDRFHSHAVLMHAKTQTEQSPFLLAWGYGPVGPPLDKVAGGYWLDFTELFPRSFPSNITICFQSHMIRPRQHRHKRLINSIPATESLKLPYLNKGPSLSLRKWNRACL